MFMAANRNVPLDLRLAVDCMVKLAQLKSEVAVYIFRSVGNRHIFSSQDTVFLQT